MSTVPVPEGRETQTRRIAAVVASLVLGLFIWMPLGAVLAFASALWIKQRRTRIWLLIIGAVFTLVTLVFLGLPGLPWTVTTVSGGGAPQH